MLHANLALVV